MVQHVFRVIAVVYMAAVVGLILAGMNFAGSVNRPWIWLLILITMPLSGASFWGTWALIHGADLEYFAAFYLACGTVNVWLASRIVRAVSHARRTLPNLPLQPDERQDDRVE